MTCLRDANLRCIAFDADDTLWRNEEFYRGAHARFADLLADYAPPEGMRARLVAAEARNLGRYGFGIKGFTLSMIETAIEVTQGAVPASVISQIIAEGQEMLAHPVQLLPHVAEVLDTLAAQRPLILITKGELLDQERKLAASGLGDHFRAVHIVSDKTEAVYARILSGEGVAPEEALMVGNSLRSDILPMLGVGSWAVHVPAALTWEYEQAEAPDHPRFIQIADFGALPAQLGF
ncbi:HAD family hydrolase [Roseovarius sp. LXJ103]|uniref:HAD family hydrolase n=1 Tax=Roseovarius carneus TaxID=2853164 RepID=UPI000D617B0D|nr:HAD family hydrolase [Roseovarius carneus]MBZ8118028.1 HAD family hydrolase [Roseovarius carneus]PWE36225.1 HAD family hydrolase [Pelagicola sp. LXJ1103]